MDKILLVAVAVVLSGFPLAAGAKPFPAGRCTTLDDGTDQPAPGWRGSGSEPIVMELPKQTPNAAGALNNTFVVDLAFSIQADGAVSSPQVLCSNANDPGYVQALLQTALHWRFKPPAAQDGRRMIPVAYRITISPQGKETEEIPLGLRAT
jgi:TonB family protein